MPAPARSIQSSKKPVPSKPSTRGPRTTVLHLCADLEPGDPGRETVDLAVLTQRAGWRSLIASRGGLLVQEAERAAVRHTRMPIGGESMFAGWRSHLQLSALVQKERPVLIHAHGLTAAMNAFNVARAHRLPLVVDCTQPLPEQARTRRALKRLNKITAAVRVPSDFMGRQICDVFKWPSERLQLIPPGIDMQWYNATAISTERLQALSRLWRLPEQGTVIVMPMPFVPGGGHAVLLEALAQLKRNDIFAVLVGDNRPAPGLRDEIEQLVTRFGLDGKVIMPDYCLDWPAACWLAHMVVSPNSIPRGQGFELLVAQAIGRPVIVSECGANREMVQDGETAWIVPPDNVHALTAALRDVIGLNTKRRLELTQSTRDFVTEHFPQANWFNATMELYDSLLLPTARRAKAAA